MRWALLVGCLALGACDFQAPKAGLTLARAGWSEDGVTYHDLAVGESVELDNGWSCYQDERATRCASAGVETVLPVPKSGAATIRLIGPEGGRVWVQATSKEW